MLPRLPKLPSPPPPSQAAVARMIANLITDKRSPWGLVVMMTYDADGKQLLQRIAAVSGAEEVLQPFRDDPESWKALSNIPPERLLKFANDFIAEAKKAIA